MSLTKEEVLKIAKLSKLSFEEAEIEKFQIELNRKSINRNRKSTIKCT